MSQSSEPKPANMTARQETWFASVIESMERETGKSLETWVAIARTCPETKPGARKAWLKAHHGLGTNRAGVILARAFPDAAMWARPDDLRGALWANPGSRAILEAVEAAVADYPGLVAAQRRAFNAFSREFQFAAIKPTKDGGAVLGLAVAPDADPRLAEPKTEGWSERLKAKVLLGRPAAIDASVEALLKQAWERS